MAKTTSRSSDGWSEELKRMEQVMNVYDELGGENEPQLADLVTPYRRFVRGEEIMLRQAPFSTSKPVPRIMYLFQDLIVIASQPKSILSSPLRKSIGKKSSQGGGWRSLLRKNSASSTGSADSPQTGRKSRSSSATRRLNLTHKIDLQKSSIKCLPQKFDDMRGVQLTQVTREQQMVNIPGATSKTGTLKVVTKIEKFEFWMEDDELQNSIYKDIQSAIETLDDEQERKRLSSEESEMSASSGKQRKWAHAKSISKSSRASRLSRHSRSASGSSAGSTATYDSVIGLGLKDIEARYRFDKSDYSSNNGGADKKEFLVQFGEGPMGFSLSSGEGVGVIVGRLATGSFAELGGVEIGDRVMSINDTEITLKTQWQQAVEVIKNCPRPVTIKFERYNAVSAKVKGAEDKEDSRKRAPSGQRRWARKRSDRAQSHGSRLLSLKELEKMYDASKSTDITSAIKSGFERMAKHGTESERMCVSVLREMYETERAYVTDLRTLVGDYILPLRRTTQRIRCKDVQEGSRVCEHKKPRSTCRSLSSEVKPIMSPDEIRGVFMNVETLVKVNSELLHVIQKGMGALCENGKTPSLVDAVGVYAPAFVKVMPFFKMYSLYCHQYSMAIDRLLVCRSRNKELDQLLISREERSKQSSLQSLLIKPVQRICKYPLLFNELIKNITPYIQEAAKSSHSLDTLGALVTDLEQAARTVQQIATTVNRKVGEKDNLERFMEVYVELGGEYGVPELVQPSRRFIATFDVNYRSTPFDDKNEIKRAMLYVFNDLLIFAKGTSAGFNTIKRNTSVGSIGSASTRTSSLKKSFHSLVSTASAVSSETMKHASGSNRSSSGRSSGSIKQLYKKVSEMDVQNLKIKDNLVKDAGVSFVLTHVVRKREEDVAASRKSSMRRKQSKSSASKGTSRVLTSINKYEVWCRDAEQRNELFQLIVRLCDKINQQEADQREAEQAVGPSGIKKKKSWFHKHRARSGSSLSSSDAGSATSASILENIERKYQQR